MANNAPQFLFVINSGSGKQKTDWSQEIRDYFKNDTGAYELFELPESCDLSTIKDKINKVDAPVVVAVGGDGTVKLLTSCLVNTDRVLGVLPAGSANGTAKELAIPDEPSAALDVLVKGHQQQIHLVKINGELCIHLSDIGFNAFLVKKFEENNTRGMWGYFKAAWNVLWRHRKMMVNLQTDKEQVSRMAAMVVIANATKYGNGVVINPEGSLKDDSFEVVIIRKISLSEIFKMRFTQKEFNPAKTELFQTKSLDIQSRHAVHFQIDGEVKGRVKNIKAEIVPKALRVIMQEQASL